MAPLSQELEPPANPGRFKTVIVLQVLKILVKLIAKYKQTLEEHVVQPDPADPRDEKELSGQLSRLGDFEGLLLLALAWKESGSVSDRELTRAALSRSFPGEPITRNALGAVLEESSNEATTYHSGQRFARRAGRLVDAGITYGMLQADSNPQFETRENMKPICGTDALDGFLRQVILEYAIEMHEAFEIIGPAAVKLISSKSSKTDK